MVTLWIIRYRVLRFNVSGPDGLVARKAAGQLPRPNDYPWAALARIIEAGAQRPRSMIVRWRIVDLCQWMFQTFRICLSRNDDEPGAAQDAEPNVQQFSKQLLAGHEQCSHFLGAWRFAMNRLGYVARHISRAGDLDIFRRRRGDLAKILWHDGRGFDLGRAEAYMLEESIGEIRN